MAVQDTSVAPQSKTPYQLDLNQTVQACKVLLKHISEERTKRSTAQVKKNLLADGEASGDDDDSAEDGDPVWLIMTTKKHIVDQQRLKPSKITLPHPLNTSPSTTICLITAEPQRAYKDTIANPSFPDHLRTRITRIIDVSKLKSKYKQFENRRQLLAEHDIFLADDRIVLGLPKLLGKTFYKGGSKRPVPVSIAGSTRKRDANGRTVKKSLEERDHENKGDKQATAASPEAMAREIEKSLKAALVHLAPGTSTAVKVARASFPAEQVTQNVEAVVNGLTKRFVTKGWRNVRAIHIKGANTMAFPIWEASELWVQDEDVLEEKKKLFGNSKKSKPKAIESAVAAEGSRSAGIKRKAEDVTKPTAEKHAKKKRKAEVDEKLAQETALRKERLKKQKKQALAEVGTGVL